MKPPQSGGFAAIYARQSVEKRDSISIEQQIERCKGKLAEGDRWEVYRESASGKDIAGRSEFRRMMEDVRAGRVSKIVVYRLDRISRSLTDFANMWEELREHRVRFVSCGEEFDTTTPMGDAMLKIAMVFAEMERNVIVQRVTDAYFSRARRGYDMGGYAPFGFRKVDHSIDGKRTKALEAVPEQADLIRSLFADCAYGDATIGGLARRLGEKGITSPRGSHFTSSSLGRMLRNPVYARADDRVRAYLSGKGADPVDPPEAYTGEHGCYLYAQRSASTGKGSGRSLSDLGGALVVLAPHRGIVPARVWLDCQQKLDGNHRLSCAHSGTHTWMSGLMVCANCGTGVTVVNNNRGRNYISCYGRKKHTCGGRAHPWRLEEVECLAEPQLLTRLKGLAEVRAPADDGEQSRELVLWRGQAAALEAELRGVEEEILAAASQSAKLRWRERLETTHRRLEQINAAMAAELRVEAERKGSGGEEPPAARALRCWNSPGGMEMAAKQRVARALIDAVVIGDTRENGVQVYFK